MTPGNAVSVHDVVVDYRTPRGPVRALDHTSLDIAGGSSVAIMGPSGCGKSTLLGLLAGLAVPTAGTVTIGDQVVSALSERARVRFRRQALGVVYQADNLLPHLTIEENVAARGGDLSAEQHGRCARCWGAPREARPRRAGHAVSGSTLRRATPACRGGAGGGAPTSPDPRRRADRRVGRGERARRDRVADRPTPRRGSHPRDRHPRSGDRGLRHDAGGSGSARDEDGGESCRLGMWWPIWCGTHDAPARPCSGLPWELDCSAVCSSSWMVSPRR